MRKLSRRRFNLHVAGAAILLVAPSALAQSTVNAEIMVLHATQSATPSIDPQIGNLPQLTKPPFSAYNTYKLLDRKSLALEKGKPATYTMVNSRILQVVFQEMTADKRYKVSAAINQPGDGGAFLKLLEVTAAANETFFVAGQSYNGGILVIGFTLKP